MESIFEDTFRKHSGLITEKYSPKRKLMTDEQNAALKNLYIIIRDCVEDIRVECRSEKINTKNCESKFPEFLENYVPKNPYITAVNYETLSIQIPKSIKDLFEDLKEELLLKIVSKDKPVLKSGKDVIAKAGLVRNDKDNSISALYIRFDILLDDLFELKANLQHELQHILIKGKANGLRDGKDKLHAMIKYLGDESEIQSYAKEYAYRYHKKYPRDTELKIEKLKKLFNNQQSEGFNHYMLFGEDDDTIKSKHDVSSSDIKKMNKIHDEFAETVKNSLNYFL